MRFIHPLVPLAVALAFAGAARAEGLTVDLNHTARLPVRGVANVVIGNSGIADVTVVDPNTVYVSGRAYGSTDVVVTDRIGRVVYDGNITVGRPAGAVAVFHGLDRTDFACAGPCSETSKTARPDSGGGTLNLLQTPSPIRAADAH